MDRDSKFIITKVVIDFIILVLVAAPVLALYLWGQPFERGFFCDDESIRHPYNDSTVTNLMLYIFGLGVPIITMCLTEYGRMQRHAAERRLLGRPLPPWLISAYAAVGVFCFGAAAQQLTTDVAKYTIGRLRPHFISVCQPNIDCRLESNRWKYITNFTCEGTDAKLLREARLSFPSGHSSFSAYTMIFFALYLHKRLTWSGSKLLRHGLQFLLVLLTWFTTLSRVSDYKHHWSDVMAGFMIGSLYAVLVFTFVSDLRIKKKNQLSVATHYHDSELHTNNGHMGRQV